MPDLVYLAAGLIADLVDRSKPTKALVLYSIIRIQSSTKCGETMVKYGGQVILLADNLLK